jgi:serine/threonine protein kinase
MPNHYDRIFKENIEPMIPFIARKLFGIKEIKQSEDIKDKLQYTLEKEADYLQRIIHPNPEDDYILHVECQVKDDNDMIYFKTVHTGVLLPNLKISNLNSQITQQLPCAFWTGICNKNLGKSPINHHRNQLLNPSIVKFIENIIQQ